MRHARPIIARCVRDESGFAVMIAIGVLAITLALAGVATSVALDTNWFSNRDNGVKSALEAADAGLRTAVYRLNAQKPGANQCPTGTTFASVDSNGLCPQDGPESLGNNAAFSYWISRQMQTGDTCTGPAVSNTASDVAQRCVTAVGTMNGQSVRLQERVAAYSSTPVFPTAIFGTKSVTISNNVTITSDTLNSPGLLGTNGVLNIAPSGGGTTTIDGYAIPCTASVVQGGNVTNLGPANSCVPRYPVPTPINPSTSSQNTQSPYDTAGTYQGGTCAVAAPMVLTNCDYRISRGTTYPGCLSGVLPVTDCDLIQGNKGVTWDPTGRTLYVGINTTLTLGGGTYNFCSLYLANNATLKLQPNAQTTIFIDSPSDPNSGAPSSAPATSAHNPACSNSNSAQGVAPGSLTLNNGASLNAGGTALNLQLFVYGDTTNLPPTNTVNLSNVSSSAYELDAPFSNVVLSPSNNSLFRGAIVGYTVSIGNAAHFVYEADSSSLQSGSLEIYYRMSYEQCSMTGFSSATPITGC